MVSDTFEYLKWQNILKHKVRKRNLSQKSSVDIENKVIRNDFLITSKVKLYSHLESKWVHLTEKQLQSNSFLYSMNGINER